MEELEDVGLSSDDDASEPGSGSGGSEGNELRFSSVHCPFCKLQFARVDSVTRHLNSSCRVLTTAATGDKRWAMLRRVGLATCKYCNKIFPSQRSVFTHHQRGCQAAVADRRGNHC